MDFTVEKYISYIGLLAVFCFACKNPNTNGKALEQKGVKPNVILIMADDMGYNDLGCYGNTSIATPNIDSLAEAGFVLTNYHSNGVVCSPTRASLLTGLYPQEAGVEGVVTAKNHRHTGMSTENYTVSEFLKESDYSTALLGKWHLGYLPEFGPNVQGFDYFSGFVSGNIDYVSHIDQEGNADWWNNQNLENETGYLTSLISQKGIEYLEQINETKPFFLYLAHGAPHYPYQGPHDQADRTPNGDFPVLGSRKDIKIAYKEMIESLDKNVGELMAYLKKNNLIDNTLVIFCSDNGATKNAGSNAPFSGYKAQLYEGGHRVPAIFYWKNKIQAGTSDEMVLSMDIFPTIADLLDLELKEKLSGQSAAPLFDSRDQNNFDKERIVFWRFMKQKAAQKGKWKLLCINGNHSLFDLNEDKKETNDVKEEFPDIYIELKQALEDWESNLNEDGIIT